MKKKNKNVLIVFIAVIALAFLYNSGHIPPFYIVEVNQSINPNLKPLGVLSNDIRFPHASVPWGVGVYCYVICEDDYLIADYNGNCFIQASPGPVKSLQSGLCYDNTYSQLSNLKLDYTSYSYEQYSIQDAIKSTLTLKDGNGNSIDSSRISKFQVYTSLSLGTIINTTYEEKGLGVYDILSKITGQGTYSAYIVMIIDGKNVVSKPIVIKISPSKVNIDTSKIPAGAKINERVNIQFSTYDSLSRKIKPDDLTVKITYPDGITTQTLKNEEISSNETGDFSFSFLFPQTEKFTIAITTSKDKMETGSASSSVAVTGSQDLTAGPPVLNYLTTIVPWIFVGFIVIVVIIYFLARRKK